LDLKTAALLSLTKSCFLHKGALSFSIMHSCIQLSEGMVHAIYKEQPSLIVSLEPNPTLPVPYCFSPPPPRFPLPSIFVPCFCTNVYKAWEKFILHARSLSHLPVNVNMTGDRLPLHPFGW
jgi:hypothetical protein